MKTLNEKNQKTLEALKAKSDLWGKSRMPSVKRIAALLEELGVEFKLISTSVTKPRGGATAAFHTSGGRKVTNGWVLKVPAANIHMDTTCSWFSMNTQSFAEDFVKFIEKN